MLLFIMFTHAVNFFFFPGSNNILIIPHDTHTISVLAAREGKGSIKNGFVHEEGSVGVRLF